MNRFIIAIFILSILGRTTHAMQLNTQDQLDLRVKKFANFQQLLTEINANPCTTTLILYLDQLVDPIESITAIASAFPSITKILIYQHSYQSNYFSSGQKMLVANITVEIRDDKT